MRYPFLHYYLSGSPSDPHAGVGFAIPTPLLPIVHDFHPWDSRLAVLILNARPCRVALFTIYAPSQLNDPSQDHKRKEKFWHQLHQFFNHYSSQYIPILIGDFNARLAPNFTQSLPDLFGSTIFAPGLDEDLYPSTNLFHLTDFLSSNELSVISTTRSRPPARLVTYQDIVADPPPPSSPTLDSYAVLHHVMCPQEHRHLFRSIRSHPSISLPYHHHHFLISASIRLPSFRSPRRPPPPSKLDFSNPSSKLLFQSSLLSQADFPAIPPSSDPPFEVFLDGSCPDQHSVSYSNPAGWGVYFANLDLDFFGPVGSLPCLVKGSNNTAELQAPLEAISYILSLPYSPTNIHFFFDSQYVIDILQGTSLPSANLQLATLLLDYYIHLSTLATITPQSQIPRPGEASCG